MDAETPNRLKPPLPMRERIARTIWFGYVDYQGYPNGHMTYDELPQHERDRLLYQADTLLKWEPGITKSAPAHSSEDGGAVT